MKSSLPDVACQHETKNYLKSSIISTQRVDATVYMIYAIKINKCISVGIEGINEGKTIRESQVKTANIGCSRGIGFEYLSLENYKQYKIVLGEGMTCNLKKREFHLVWKGQGQLGSINSIQHLGIWWTYLNLGILWPQQILNIRHCSFASRYWSIITDALGWCLPLPNCIFDHVTVVLVGHPFHGTKKTLWLAMNKAFFGIL